MPYKLKKPGMKITEHPTHSTNEHSTGIYLCAISYCVLSCFHEPCMVMSKTLLVSLLRSASDVSAALHVWNIRMEPLSLYVLCNLLKLKRLLKSWHLPCWWSDYRILLREFVDLTPSDHDLNWRGQNVKILVWLCLGPCQKLHEAKNNMQLLSFLPWGLSYDWSINKSINHSIL